MTKHSVIRLYKFTGLFLLVALADSAWLQPAMPADPFYLNVVFPAARDTFAFEEIRYAGATLPHAEMRVQGKRTRVYPTGAFVGMVTLEPGWNDLVFEASSDGGSLLETVSIFCDPELELPSRPTQIDMKRLPFTSDVMLTVGHTLDVELWGSPGGRAWFSIPGLVEKEMMREISPRSNGRAGLYRGEVVIPDTSSYQAVPLNFFLRGRDRTAVQVTTRGRLHVLSADQHFIGVTVDSVNSVFSHVDGAPVLSLPAGIKMRIVAEMQGFRKVQLARDIFGYMPKSQLRLLPEAGPLPPAQPGGLTISEYTDWVHARIRLSRKVPYEIRQTTMPPMLEVIFYNVIGEPALHNRLRPPLENITWQQTDDRLSMQLMLDQSQQWGYWGNFFSNAFLLNIRKSPAGNSRAPGSLSGVRVTVDAGHGGNFEGAVGATGLTEKSVNLRIAELTAGLLQQYGAVVSITHVGDTTMSLPARIEVARKSNTHIFLSIHNNSIAPNRDPLKPRGTSVFYYTPQSRELAIKIYAQLLDLELEPFGCLRSNYFVTRQTDMLAVLIEGAFLTHPLDEMLLLDEMFLRRMAGAIAKGVSTFADEQLEIPSPLSP